MEIKTFAFNPFSQNTYVISDQNQAWIIDPGNSNESENQQLFDYIHSNELVVQAIVLTHAHIDHVLGLSVVDKKFKVPVLLHPIEKEILDLAPLSAQRFGMEFQKVEPELKFIEEGEELILGKLRFKVIHVPGHSPGHVAFYNEDSQMLISGDVLFQGSIGRTDLYKGNGEQLLQSIREKIFTLPENTVVYPGHGPHTLVGFEKEHNPFF